MIKSLISRIQISILKWKINRLTKKIEKKLRKEYGLDINVRAVPLTEEMYAQYLIEQSKDKKPTLH